MMSSRTHRAQRRFGQNFLVDQNVVKKIINTAEIQNTDTVVEIGPGHGALTKILITKAKRVIAIELDRDLIQSLETLMEHNKQCSIVYGDALKEYPRVVHGLQNSSYLVVANIPYNITSVLIRTILTSSPLPSRAILMIQKEVAQRIIARSGEMNLLALSVQLYADVRICFDVAPGSFVPRPRVTSSVIELTPRQTLTINPEDVLTIARGAFAKKRKLLVSNLTETTGHTKEKILSIVKHCKISHQARAQDLSIEQWIILTQMIQQ